MFGVLVVVLCPDCIAGLSFSASERQILFIVSLRVLRPLRLVARCIRRPTLRARGRRPWGSVLAPTPIRLLAIFHGSLLMVRATHGQLQARGAGGPPWARHRQNVAAHELRDLEAEPEAASLSAVTVRGARGTRIDASRQSLQRPNAAATTGRRPRTQRSCARRTVEAPKGQ